MALTIKEGIAIFAVAFGGIVLVSMFSFLDYILFRLVLSTVGLKEALRADLGDSLFYIKVQGRREICLLAV